MPPPSQPSEQQSGHEIDGGGRKGACKQGITIEDLKQQTAVRLAQEQHRRIITTQQHHRPESERLVNEGAVPSLHHHHQPKSPHSSMKHRPAENYMGSPTSRKYSGYNENIQNSHPVKSRTQSNSTTIQKTFHRSDHRRNDHSFNAAANTPGSHVATNMQRDQHYVHRQQPRQHAIRQGFMKYQNQVLSPKPNKGQNLSASSKLPHGLTVQELKEMTRARLAAEADANKKPENKSTEASQTQNVHSANTNNVHRLEGNNNGQGWYQPQQQQQSVRGGILNQQQHVIPDLSLRQRQSSSESNSSSIPGPIQNPHPFVPSTSLDSARSNPYQPSPFANNENQQPQQALKLNEAFENCSVNSFNSGVGSEYLGSEHSGFHPITSPISSNSTYLGARSLSFPTEEIGTMKENNSLSPSILKKHSSHEDSIRNRRRAATVSPSFLSQLHEDKIVTSDISTSFFPDNSDTTSSQPPVPAFNIVRSSSSMSDSRSSPANVTTDLVSNLSGEERSWCEIFGRPSSAQTVPMLTPSWERECHENENKLLPLSGIAERNISIGAISKNGELPNSVAESVLGPSTLHENSVLYGGGNSHNINVYPKGKTSAFSMVQEVDKPQQSQSSESDCFVPLSNEFPSQVTSIAENAPEGTSGMGQFWSRARYSCGVDTTVEQLRGCWPNISLDSTKPPPGYNRSISLESKIDPEFRSTVDNTLSGGNKLSRKVTSTLSSLQTDDEYSRLMKSADVANENLSFVMATNNSLDGSVVSKSGHRRKKSKS